MSLKKFNKTIIPFALVGFEIVIANSYATHTHGIISKYYFIQRNICNDVFLWSPRFQVAGSIHIILLVRLWLTCKEQKNVNSLSKYTVRRTNMEDLESRREHCINSMNKERKFISSAKATKQFIRLISIFCYDWLNDWCHFKAIVISVCV